MVVEAEVSIEEAVKREGEVLEVVVEEAMVKVEEEVELEEEVEREVEVVEEMEVEEGEEEVV